MPTWRDDGDTWTYQNEDGSETPVPKAWMPAGPPQPTPGLPELVGINRKGGGDLHGAAEAPGAFVVPPSPVQPSPVAPGLEDRGKAFAQGIRPPGPISNPATDQPNPAPSLGNEPIRSDA